MKVVYLRRALVDLAWFKAYYDAVFPEGAKLGHRKFSKTLDLIAAHPSMGRPLGKKGRREYSIPGIPFSVIYRASPDVIEIVRIWDERGERPPTLRRS